MSAPASTATEHVRVPLPQLPYLSMNDRSHWAAKARRVRDWRKAAGWAAIAHRHLWTPGTSAYFTVELGFRTNTRRDPANYVATLKPIVDGFVDAGWWPDDNPIYVEQLVPRCVVQSQPVVTAVIWPCRQVA